MDSVVSSALPTSTGDQLILAKGLSKQFPSNPSISSLAHASTGFLPSSSDTVPCKDGSQPSEWMAPDSIQNRTMSVPDVDYIAKPATQTPVEYKVNQQVNESPAVLSNSSKFDPGFTERPPNNPINISGYKRNSLPQDLTTALKTHLSSAILDPSLPVEKRDFDFSAPHSTLNTPSSGSVAEQPQPSSNLATKYPALAFTPPSGSALRPASFGVSTTNMQYKPFF